MIIPKIISSNSNNSCNYGQYRQQGINQGNLLSSKNQIKSSPNNSSHNRWTNLQFCGSYHYVNSSNAQSFVSGCTPQRQEIISKSKSSFSPTKISKAKNSFHRGLKSSTTSVACSASNKIFSLIAKFSTTASRYDTSTSTFKSSAQKTSQNQSHSIGKDYIDATCKDNLLGTSSSSISKINTPPLTDNTSFHCSDDKYDTLINRRSLVNTYTPAIEPINSVNSFTDLFAVQTRSLTESRNMSSTNEPGVDNTIKSVSPSNVIDRASNYSNGISKSSRANLTSHHYSNPIYSLSRTNSFLSSSATPAANYLTGVYNNSSTRRLPSAYGSSGITYNASNATNGRHSATSLNSPKNYANAPSPPTTIIEVYDDTKFGLAGIKKKREAKSFSGADQSNNVSDSTITLLAGLDNRDNGDGYFDSRMGLSALRSTTGIRKSLLNSPQSSTPKAQSSSIARKEDVPSNFKFYELPNRSEQPQVEYLINRFQKSNKRRPIPQIDGQEQSISSGKENIRSSTKTLSDDAEEPTNAITPTPSNHQERVEDQLLQGLDTSCTVNQDQDNCFENKDDMMCNTQHQRHPMSSTCSHASADTNPPSSLDSPRCYNMVFEDDYEVEPNYDNFYCDKNFDHNSNVDYDDDDDRIERPPYYQSMAPADYPQSLLKNTTTAPFHARQFSEDSTTSSFSSLLLIVSSAPLKHSRLSPSSYVNQNNEIAGTCNLDVSPSIQGNRISQNENEIELVHVQSPLLDLQPSAVSPQKALISSSSSCISSVSSSCSATPSSVPDIVPKVDSDTNNNNCHNLINDVTAHSLCNVFQSSVQVQDKLNLPFVSSAETSVRSKASSADHRIGRMEDSSYENIADSIASSAAVSDDIINTEPTINPLTTPTLMTRSSTQLKQEYLGKTSKGSTIFHHNSTVSIDDDEPASSLCTFSTSLTERKRAAFSSAQNTPEHKVLANLQNGPTTERAASLRNLSLSDTVQSNRIAGVNPSKWGAPTSQPHPLNTSTPNGPTFFKNQPKPPTHSKISIENINNYVNRVTKHSNNSSDHSRTTYYNNNNHTSNSLSSSLSGGGGGRPRGTLNHASAFQNMHPGGFLNPSSSMPTAYITRSESRGSVASLTSIVSLASSTSYLSPHELQQLIDNANQSLDQSGTSADHVIDVIILYREHMGGGIGITLAGGIDQEQKEIRIHKVITGSVADKDGRTQKGDRVLSINGRTMHNLTHRQSVEILKTPRPEVVLVISRPKEDASSTNRSISNGNYNTYQQNIGAQKSTNIPIQNPTNYANPNQNHALPCNKNFTPTKDNETNRLLKNGLPSVGSYPHKTHNGNHLPSELGTPLPLIHRPPHPHFSEANHKNLSFDSIDHAHSSPVSQNQSMSNIGDKNSHSAEDLLAIIESSDPFNATAHIDSSLNDKDVESSLYQTPCGLNLLTSSLGHEEAKANTIRIDNKMFQIELENQSSCGLGISLEGGKASLNGDKPITIKRIFKGGTADKCRLLQPGDEILQINDQPTEGMTHFQAWNLVKSLVEGKVTLTIKKGHHHVQNK